MVKLSRFQNILMFEFLDLYCYYVSFFWELNHRGLILWISLDAQFFFSLCNSHQFTIKYGIFMSVCCFKCLIPYHRIPPSHPSGPQWCRCSPLRKGIPLARWRLPSWRGNPRSYRTLEAMHIRSDATGMGENKNMMGKKSLKPTPFR